MTRLERLGGSVLAGFIVGAVAGLIAWGMDALVGVENWHVYIAGVVGFLTTLQAWRDAA